MYLPDFHAECWICGESPCVVVYRHEQPSTDLCGPHFFKDQSMTDWMDWNFEDEDMFVDD